LIWNGYWQLAIGFWLIQTEKRKQLSVLSSMSEWLLAHTKRRCIYALTTIGGGDGGDRYVINVAKIVKVAVATRRFLLHLQQLLVVETSLRNLTP